MKAGTDIDLDGRTIARIIGADDGLVWIHTEHRQDDGSIDVTAIPMSPAKARLVAVDLLGAADYVDALEDDEIVEPDECPLCGRTDEHAHHIP